MRLSVAKFFKDITGQQFGYLTVLYPDPIVHRIGSEGRAVKHWICRCSCGNLTSTNTSRLLGGYVKSCGCLVKEVLSKSKKTHGIGADPIYAIWNSIRHRCYNPNSKSYKWYGAIGITMCQEWLDPFQGPLRFKSWALSNGYEKGLSIERQNNEKGYSPENCQWVGMLIQNNNKRNNLRLEYKNEIYSSAKKLVREHGKVPYRLFLHRYQDLGWTVEDALEIPSRGKRNKQ